MLPLPAKLDNWIKNDLFNTVPIAIGVIDQAFNVIYANGLFEETYGVWQGRKCYSVYKNRASMCDNCSASQSFQDGKSRKNEEVGYDKNGRLTSYFRHAYPVVDDEGDIPFMVLVSTDITEAEQIRREYQLLFDQVPCNILIIDNNFRITKTNKRVRKILGNIEGSYCFKELKGFDHPCSECTARQTFKDGKLHTGHHVWNTREGETIHLHVITVPIRLTDDSFNMVMELAVDVTQTLKLEDGLNFAHSFLETMIATSMDGIFAVDKDSNITIFNHAAHEIFKIKDNQPVSICQLTSMLPDDFFNHVAKGAKHIYLPETTITDYESNELPVRLVGNQLVMADKSIGMAFTIQDLSEIKKLEKEKFEAQHLATVGQTVAGLAHGIKNLITALEGGMYMLSSGISKSKFDRVQNGIEMLTRNIERIGKFVKTFLVFSKEREIHPRLNDPGAIAQEVVESFAANAQKLGIHLAHEQKGNISLASIDYESMHECLTNMVDNALYGCRTSEKETQLSVIVRTFEKNDVIIYEVSDNGCGMDSEHMNKIFSTFFTTKGLEGTGIGLLMVKKLVQKHGGKIYVKSKLNEGTTFCVHLPRKNLPEAEVEQPSSDENNTSP